MATKSATNVNAPASKDDNGKASYWKRMLKNYERRNASLERRRTALVERVRFMECTLPSLLVGAAASAAYRGQAVEEHRKTSSRDAIKQLTAVHKT